MVVKINPRRKTSELEDRLVPEYLIKTLVPVLISLWHWQTASLSAQGCLHFSVVEILFLSSRVNTNIKLANIFKILRHYLNLLNVIYYTHISLCLYYVCMHVCVCVFAWSQDVCGCTSVRMHVHMRTYVCRSLRLASDVFLHCSPCGISRQGVSLDLELVTRVSLDAILCCHTHLLFVDIKGSTLTGLHAYNGSSSPPEPCSKAHTS